MKAGDTVTFITQHISETGLIINEPNDKAVVREVEIIPSYFGAATGQYYPERILGIKLEGYDGLWRPECFYEYTIGRKVAKKSVTKKKGLLKGKPFKSGLLINTVKGVVEHKQLGIPAYVFEEDDSYVECRRCRVLEDYEVNKYTKHQQEILKMIEENPNKIIITAEQGLGKK